MPTLIQLGMNPNPIPSQDNGRSTAADIQQHVLHCAEIHPVCKNQLPRPENLSQAATAHPAAWLSKPLASFIYPSLIIQNVSEKSIASCCSKSTLAAGTLCGRVSRAKHLYVYSQALHFAQSDNRLHEQPSHDFFEIANQIFLIL